MVASAAVFCLGVDAVVGDFVLALVVVVGAPLGTSTLMVVALVLSRIDQREILVEV